MQFSFVKYISFKKFTLSAKVINQFVHLKSSLWAKIWERERKIKVFINIKNFEQRKSCAEVQKNT